MIQGVQVSNGAYLSSSTSTKGTSEALLEITMSSKPESVYTIERGTGVYETYMRNGVVKKLQYVGSNLSKTV